MKLLRNTVLPAILLSTSPALWAKTCAVTISANEQTKFDQETTKLSPEC
ncbi:azurin, partial [Xylella fastidiosa subsp. multiplex]|nr:azurin [Xylella fastidiosa subsp. multiplex]